MKQLLAAAITLVLLTFSAPAFADCTPAGAEGKIVYNADFKVLQYCDGTNWIVMHGEGSGSGGCANPARPESRMIYNADQRVMQACAGNIWRAMGPVKPSPDQLAAHWQLDETAGTTAADASGAGHSGAMQNGLSAATDSVPGALGTGLKFTGASSHYVDFGDPAGDGLDLGTGDFSIAFWMKADDADTFTVDDTLLAKGNWYSSARPSYGISRDYGGGCRSLVLDISDGTAAPAAFSSGGCSGFFWADAGWHHVAYTVDRDGQAKLYRDGSLYTTGDLSAESGSLSSTAYFFLGAARVFNGADAGPPTGYYFNGSLDDVLIYRRALTAADVAALYARGHDELIAHWPLNENVGSTSAADLAGDSIGFVSGSVTFVPGGGKIGGAALIDSVDDQILMPVGALKPAPSLSFGGWFKPEDAGNEATQPVGWDGGTANAYAVLIDQAGAEAFGCSMWDGGGAETHAIWVTAVDNQWYHVFCVVDDAAKQIRLYVDNTLRATQTYTGTLTYNVFGSQRLFIGEDPTPGQWLYTGLLDDFRIYDRVLSVAEIDKVYQAGLQGTEAVPDCLDPDRIEGTLLYNSSHGVMQYCDGAGWVRIGK